MGPDVRRRVVITGVGLLTPLGEGTEPTWRALAAGRSGISRIERFDTAGFPVQIGGEVKGFAPEAYFSAEQKKEARRTDRYTQFAVAAARFAVSDAGLSQEALSQAACLIGTAFGGIATMEEGARTLHARGPDRLSPFFVPMMLPNMASGVVAMVLGAHGPNMATVSACASGAHAVGEGMQSIRRGDAQVVLAGGAEAALTPLGLAGFCAARALSTRDCPPSEASRPFDAERDGFVMAEGAAVLVLESYEHAAARGARIYAEVAGYASSADAHHLTQPPEDGAGAVAAMRAALAAASCPPEAVDYINAHGTSTPAGDAAESAAIRAVFGERPSLLVSSTKSMTGHLLGAAGALESGLCALSLARGTVLPTINYHRPDPRCLADPVPNEARRVRLQVALNNAFGFGGHNAVVVLRAPEAGMASPPSGRPATED
ncbi:MAG TPA: beta-ketoacyl-ACP synthase II [Limnochordia bacterium]|nr:beta-ketoacyl-ACP synthase II [Limnochordia bacterium]